MEEAIRTGKTGYVALVGRPNTGKSTLLNTLLGQHLAAVSPKPQTTRRHLLGILTDKDSQILFLDAPGIHKSKIAIDQSMDKSIARVLEDAEIVVCMADPTREAGEEDGMAVERVQAAKKPVIIAINKIDVATAEQIEACREYYTSKLPNAQVVQIAAIKSESAQPLLAKLKELLPVGPFLHDEDDVTDVYERDIAAELIRETILEQLKQEVPHSVAVVVDRWNEKEKRISIGATLHIEREGHKAIIIGKGGERIKAIRIAAVKRIAEFVGKFVDLSLFVKVTPDWRSNKRFLNEIGME